MIILKNASNGTIYKFIMTSEEQKNNAVYKENESYTEICL